MKVLIAGGGTGGHVYPALSIADAIGAIVPGVEISFAGREEGLEDAVVKARGYAFYPVQAGQIRGKGVGVVQSGVKILAGLGNSIGLLQEVTPDIVVGVGGYVSFPVGMASALLKKRLVLHEQNSIPGSANRFLARFAEKVFTGFKRTGEYFSEGKILYTGNPLRYDLVKRGISAKKEGESPYGIFILGGSAGAARLNDFALSLASIIRKENLPFRIFHQTGKAHFTKMKEKYEGMDDLVECFPFSDEIWRYYERARFAVARAGAVTISELSCFGIPSVLVPYPHAADNHQEENAREFEKAGCGIYLREEKLDPREVIGFFQELLEKEDRYEYYRKNSKNFSRPFAADEIARFCVDLVQGVKNVQERY